MARLGVPAVGLGFGAAWAQWPVVSADSSGDWLSSIDGLLSGASPASATPTDLNISFDGYTIYNGGGNAFAVTNTGDYSLAIDYGDNAEAYGFGTGSPAFADGGDAYACTGGGTGDVAEAVGTNASASAGGDVPDTGANYDTAIDLGNNPEGGAGDGAFAGNSDLAGGFDGGTGAHDTAIDLGNNTGQSDGSQALDGDGNYTSESGSATGDYQYAYAGQGDDNTAVGVTDNAPVGAFDSDNNHAYDDGPA
jgi:hypothetical protein